MTQPINGHLQVKKQHLSEIVADRLQEMIVSGQYQVGERLPAERELAASLGVSRNILREAIKFIQERGLVNVQSGSGVYVTASEADVLSRSMTLYTRREQISIAQLFEVRWILEVENARLAARKADANRIAELWACLQRMQSTLDSPSEFTQIDVEYHRLLAVATLNPVLPMLLDTITDSISQQLSMTASLPGAQINALKHHQAIYDAVASHDTEAAYKAMSTHLKDSWRWLLRVIDNSEEEIGEITFPIE